MLNVDQSVNVVPTTENGTITNLTNANQATFTFTDANTGAPVLMFATVGADGIALPPSSTVSFIPGQTLYLQPPAGFTDPITVTPSLQQYYSVSNQIGLDIEDLFDVKALTADINVEGDDLGPWTAYDSGPDVFIGPAQIKSWTDTLPSQLSFNAPLSSTPGSWVVNQGPIEQAIDSIGDIPAGQSVTVNVDANYSSGPPGTMTSSFSVVGDQLDLDLSNNSLQESALLVGPAVYYANTETDLRTDIAQVDNAVNPAFPPIIFLNPDMIINLTEGVLDVTQSVTNSTSNGARAIVNAGGLSAIFDFTGNGQQAYRIENLVLEGGNGNGNGGDGGAISIPDGGMLTIVNSRLRSKANTA